MIGSHVYRILLYSINQSNQHTGEIETKIYWKWCWWCVSCEPITHSFSIEKREVNKKSSEEEEKKNGVDIGFFFAILHVFLLFRLLLLWLLYFQYLASASSLEVKKWRCGILYEIAPVEHYNALVLLGTVLSVVVHPPNNQNVWINWNDQSIGRASAIKFKHKIIHSFIYCLFIYNFCCMECCALCFVLCRFSVPLGYAEVKVSLSLSLLLLLCRTQFFLFILLAASCWCCIQSMPPD